MTPDRHRHNRPAILAVALAFAAGLFMAWHHQATSVHGFCSEHGRRIHLDHFHGEPPASRGGATLHTDHHVTGSHDCLAMAFLGQSALRREATLPQRAPRLTVDLPATWLVLAPAQIPPLRQSPKQSPPNR